jgi:hypothetical protein
LAEQADPLRTTLVSSDGELRQAMAEAAGMSAGGVVAPDWDIEPETAWADIQRELEQRALTVSGPRVSQPQPTRTTTSAPLSLSAPIRNIPGYVKPATTSSRPGVSSLKRLVDRAVSWRVDPLARQLETMRLGLATSLDNVERRLPPVPDDHDGRPSPDVRGSDGH